MQGSQALDPSVAGLISQRLAHSVGGWAATRCSCAEPKMDEMDEITLNDGIGR